MRTVSRWKRWGVLCAGLTAAALFLSPGGVLAENEFHLSNEFSVTANDVSGPGASQSSLTDGTRYLEVFNLFGSGRLGEYDYNFTLGAKATDDDRNDINGLSLTNLQGRLTNKVHTLTLGDTFESFSQYALNTAVKGGSYKFTPEGGLPEVTLVYGVAYSRWDNFWDIDAIDRRVTGARIRQNFGADFQAGFSAVRSDDRDRVMDQDQIDNRTYTLDWEYRPIPGLTIQGESSWADGSVDSASGPDSEIGGSAHKLTAIGDGDPSRVTLEYERVSPDYQTVAGSATPDREKAKAKWRYKYAKEVTITTGFLWYHDNLDGDKDYRTDHYKPEVTVGLKRLFGRQYAAADISYKLDRAVSSAVHSSDHFFTLGYRDRFGVFDSDTNLGYTFYDANRSVERQDKEFTYNTSLSSRHTAGIFVLKPGLYLGGWTRNDELSDDTDQIYEYSASLGVDVPAWQVTSNIKVGENRLEKDAGTDSAKTFANLNVYWRPEKLAGIQGMLFMRAFVNDYRYDPSLAGGSQDFRENSLTAGLNLQF